MASQDFHKPLELGLRLILLYLQYHVSKVPYTQQVLNKCCLNLVVLQPHKH